MNKTRLPRRDFLKATVATTAALAPSAPASAQPPGAAECGADWEPPPKQQGNNLNLIVIVCDTFRADNLECYGSNWIECPNLNRFAKESVLLDDCYPEGLPTIPVRRVLYTGRRVLPFRYYPQPEPVQLPGWHPLFHEDVTLSETLQAAGYINALVADLAHLQRPGRNFHRGFNSFYWVRGQEADAYGTVPHKPLDVSDMVSADYPAQSPGLRLFLSQYKANRQLWSQEGEALVQIVVDTAVRWLKANHDQRPFYLHIESFDPHEPWDPPPRFLEKYMPNAQPPTFIQPPYEDVVLPEAIKRRFRANYAGEVTCVDFWVGKLLDTIGELGLLENSIVVFTTDHGTLLGEQEQFLKGPARLRGQVTRVPLLIRMPEKQHAGKRVAGFIQHPDLMPTLLNLLGLKPPSRVTGSNFWPLVTGETKSLREEVVQAYGWIAAIRTREWNYTRIWEPAARPAPFAPQLYDLGKDPQELTNIADKYPEVTRQLSARLQEYMDSGKEITRGSFHAREHLGMGTVYVNKKTTK